MFELIPFDHRLIIAAGLVATAGFLRGFVGFGSAMVIIPVLALTYGPREAVAMHSVMEIPAIVWLVRPAIQNAERRTILPMMIAMLVTTPIGAAILVSVSPEPMKIAISIVVLVMIGFMACDFRIPGHLGTPATICGGALGGLMQGATGLGGPPIVTALLARGDAPNTARGNILAAMAVTMLLAFGIFWSYGLLTHIVIVVGLTATPIYLLAIGLGSRYFHRGGGRHFRHTVLALLALIALASLASALGIWG